MPEIITIVYVAIVIVGMFGTMMVRLIIFHELRSSKENPDLTTFTDFRFGNFLAHIVIPFHIQENAEEPEINRMIRNLNQLKTIYWSLLLSIPVFGIVANVLEHWFDISN